MKRICILLLITLLWACGGGSSIDEENNILASRFGGFQVKDTVDLELWSDPSEQIIGNDVCTVLLGMKNQKLWVGVFDENKMEKFSWSSKDNFDPHRVIDWGYGDYTYFDIHYFDIVYFNCQDKEHYQIVTRSCNYSPEDLLQNSQYMTHCVCDLLFINTDTVTIHAGDSNAITLTKENFTQWHDGGVVTDFETNVEWILYDKYGNHELYNGYGPFSREYITYTDHNHALFLDLNNQWGGICLYDVVAGSYVWKTPFEIDHQMGDQLSSLVLNTNTKYYDIQLQIISKKGEVKRICKMSINIETGEIQL